MKSAIIPNVPDRAEQLREWEQNRLNELSLDLQAHWLRCIPAVILSATLWALAGYFGLPSIARYLIAGFTLAYLLGRIIVWLRLWGAYVERQLIDIQALLGNERPVYYQRGDLVAFDPNPLYARLEAIERSIDRVREVAHQC